jgi:hypothetical protein
MPELDPKNEEHFFKRFNKSAKANGKYTGPDSIANFRSNLRASMMRWVPSPWFMCLTISVFQARLRTHERRLTTMEDCSPAALSAQIERVDSLRFAVHYGRRANAQQRAWCLQQIDRYRIPPLAAPFLVWARAINISSQTINFGHLDWILGIFMMTQVLMLFLYALCIALCPNASPAVKAVFTTFYLAMGCGAYTFYKAITFDVFRVGLRYFRPNGWRYTPLQR